MQLKFKITNYQKLLIVLFAGASFLFFPKISNAATIYMTPASGSFAEGSSIRVTVKVNSQSAAVNTAEVRINYSTETLDLVSVSNGNNFYLASPGSPSKGTGTAYFSAGLPSPGYNGTGGVLGIMNFRAKKTGTANISISSGKVLLNDGQGTDAYTGGSGANFNITNAPPPPVGGVEVSSKSHADQNVWYAKTHVEVSWSKPTSATGFSYWVNQQPTTIPDDSVDSTGTEHEFDVQDGVWYFHIKALGSTVGTPTHFKIQVDTKAPNPFEIKLVGESNLGQLGPNPTISFETQDDASGVYGYDVYLDENLLREKIASPYTFDRIEGGEHVIRVVAYDKAGNIAKEQLVINIIGGKVGFWQKKLELPLYIFLFLVLMFIMQSIYILWLLIVHRRLERNKDRENISKDWRFPR